MRKLMKFKCILKYIVILLICILALLFFIIFICAFNEKPEQHSDNFTIHDDIKLEKDINSVQDGLIFAEVYAKGVRYDTYLSSISINYFNINNMGAEGSWYSYDFRAEYINENNPDIFLSVDIEKDLDSITYVNAKYNVLQSKDQKRSELELNDQSVDAIFANVYDKAVNELNNNSISIEECESIRVTLFFDNTCSVEIDLNEEKESGIKFLTMYFNTETLDMFDKYYR